MQSQEKALYREKKIINKNYQNNSLTEVYTEIGKIINLKKKKALTVA